MNYFYLIFPVCIFKFSNSNAFFFFQKNQSGNKLCLSFENKREYFYLSLLYIITRSICREF